MLLIALTCVLLNVFSTQQAEEHSVIVIGAGSSGLAAAVKLLDNGVNVTLLEAENRIGGRIQSIFFGDAYVDLGAEWSHGEGPTNGVHELVKDMELLRPCGTEYEIYASDGTLVDQALSDEITDIFYDIYEFVDPNGPAKEGQTMGEYFLERYNIMIDEAFENYSEKHNVSLEAIDLFKRYILSSEKAFNWNDVSAISDFELNISDIGLNWNGKGYKTILEVLMKKLPKPDPNFHIDEAIKLNSKVRKIEWNKEDGITLDVQGGRKYTAKHVVFTGSLGVLKDSHEALFSPQLPEAKKEVIQKLGSGAALKVMMHFPKNFWNIDNNVAIFNFMWTESDKKALKTSYPRGPMTEKSHWIEDFFAIHKVEKNDQVLSAWFAGPLIPEIEQMSDESLIDGIVFALNKFFNGSKTVVRPDRIARSNWHSNPNFKCSDSFETVESRELNGSAHIILSQALINENTGKAEVFFAGEATNPTLYSTVHGAIDSGFRAAEEVLKAMGK